MNLFKLLGVLAIQGTDQAERELNDVTKTAETSESKMTAAFKRIGGALAAAFAFDKIKNFAVSMVQTAANVQAETAQFEAAFKSLAGTADEMFNRVAETTGVFATRLKVTGTKAFSQLKGAGLEANDALAQTEVFLNLASDAAAYYDISLEDADERIRSFMRGNVEAGDAIGLFTSESQRNSYAMETYGKKWIALTEAQKQMLMLNVAQDIYDQSGATGQAARESDGFANVVGNLKEVWRQLLAVIGKPVLDAVIPKLQGLTAKVTELRGKVDELKQWIADNQETIDKWKERILIATGVIVGFVGALKTAQILNSIGILFQKSTAAITEYTIKLVASTMAGQVSNATLSTQNIILGVLSGQIGITTAATMLWKKAQDALNTSLLANPITWVVLAIAALVAVFVIAYKKSDEFRAAVDKLWSKIKELWATVKEQLKPAFDELMVALGELWAVIESEVLPVFKQLFTALMSLYKVLKPIIDFILSVVIEAIKIAVKIVTTQLKVIINAITTAVNIIKGIIQLFTAILKGDWQGAWEAIKNITSSYLNGIKNFISTVLGGIKNIFSGVWNWINEKTGGTFEGIKNKITGSINGARDAVKNAIEKIKGFFNFKWSLPKLKVPKFTITPSGWKVGDLLKGVKPKLGVTWAAEGGIFDSPTLFDTPTGALGVGEAGAEAVAPIDKLMGYVQAAVQGETNGISIRLDQLISILAAFFPQILENLDRTIAIDGKTLVGYLAPQMNAKFNDMARADARGR